MLRIARAIFTALPIPTFWMIVPAMGSTLYRFEIKEVAVRGALL